MQAKGLCILVYLNNEVNYNIRQWQHRKVPNKGTNAGPDEYAPASLLVFTLYLFLLCCGASTQKASPGPLLGVFGMGYFF